MCLQKEQKIPGHDRALGYRDDWSNNNVTVSALSNADLWVTTQILSTLLKGSKVGGVQVMQQKLRNGVRSCGVSPVTIEVLKLYFNILYLSHIKLKKLSTLQIYMNIFI